MARLIDAYKLIAWCERMMQDSWNNGTPPVSWAEAYADFIYDIETQETVPAYGQWIRVEDEKPDTGQYVLVKHKDGVMQCAQYLISGYDDRELWVLDHYYKEQGEITHWMPLPEPPDKRYQCRYADGDGVCSKLSGNGEIIYCVEGPCPYMFDEVSYWMPLPEPPKEGHHEY